MGFGPEQASACLGSPAGSFTQANLSQDGVQTRVLPREGRTPAYYTDAALTEVYKQGQESPYVNQLSELTLRFEDSGLANEIPWTSST